MDKLNDFFKTLYSNPALMWKAGAGFLFLTIGLVIFFLPSLLGQIEDSKRLLIAAFIGGYGLFRLVTFYVEYKQVKNDERY